MAVVAADLLWKAAGVAGQEVGSRLLNYAISGAGSYLAGGSMQSVVVEGGVGRSVAASSLAVAGTAATAAAGGAAAALRIRPGWRQESAEATARLEALLASTKVQLVPAVVADLESRRLRSCTINALVDRLLHAMQTINHEQLQVRLRVEDFERDCRSWWFFWTTSTLDIDANLAHLEAAVRQIDEAFALLKDLLPACLVVADTKPRTPVYTNPLTTPPPTDEKVDPGTKATGAVAPGAFGSGAGAPRVPTEADITRSPREEAAPVRGWLWPGVKPGSSSVFGRAGGTGDVGLGCVGPRAMAVPDAPEPEPDTTMGDADALLRAIESLPMPNGLLPAPPTIPRLLP